MTKTKKVTKRRRGQSASKAMLGSVDRTCENCRFFSRGRAYTSRILFWTFDEHDRDTCSFLAGAYCDRCRYYFDMRNEKYVEGPCKAEGIYFEPNAKLSGSPSGESD